MTLRLNVWDADPDDPIHRAAHLAAIADSEALRRSLHRRDKARQRAIRSDDLFIFWAVALIILLVVFWPLIEIALAAV